MSNLSFRVYTGHLPRFVYQTNDIKTTSYVMQLKEQTGHQFDISKNLDSLSLSNEIRQESGKEIVVLLFTESNQPSNTFRQVESTNNYTCGKIYCSSSGRYQLSYNIITNDLLCSDDYGSTWAIASIPISTNLQWTGVTCSQDGVYQYACSEDGSIWYSNDYGKSWNQYTNNNLQPNTNWTGICCSGATVIACSSNNGIWISTNNNDWNTYNFPNVPDGINWSGICCSSNGSIISAYTFNNIYNSTKGTIDIEDSGYVGICCDSTGQIQSCCTNSTIYSTTDNWLSFTTTPLTSYSSIGICCSSDGISICSICNNYSNSPYYICTNNSWNNPIYTTTTLTINSICFSNFPNNYITFTSTDGIWINH